MQYSNAHLSRIGVHSVGKIVAQNLNWIFREQPTDDYGIDAQIEICKNGKPTGQLIALQIKCGDSYFSEKTTSGFLYRGSLRHLEYWLKHSLPVVLVVYHTLLDKAFWAYIDNTKISLHENSWTIEIPNVSVLDANSIPALEALVSAGYHKRRHLISQFKFDTSPQVFPANVEQIIAALSSATATIDIVSPVVDTPFLWALKPISHFVSIRLLISANLQTDLLTDFSSNIQTWSQFEVRALASLHAKSIILDGSVAIWGSPNLTQFSWRNDTELVYATCSPDIVSEQKSIFEQLWSLSRNPVV